MGTILPKQQNSLVVGRSPKLQDGRREDLDVIGNPVDAVSDLARYATFSRCVREIRSSKFRGRGSFLDESQFLNCVCLCLWLCLLNNVCILLFRCMC
ncbi:hypothetical protein Hanom_Chr14g01265371 [Helianthus anomalus]